MSSTRTVPRTTTMNKTTSNIHHTNGSSNSYDVNDSNVNLTNTSEFDSNLQRSVLMKNISPTEGIYRNPRFVHSITSGLLGQLVIVQTNGSERLHGVLETMSPNGDIVLSVAHRLDNNNNNDIMGLSTSLIDICDTIDSSVQSFELDKRIIQSSNIVEIIGVDIDLSGNGKCMLDETPKVTQLEDERFNRMEHFYGADDIDPDALEELELQDGKGGYDPEDMFHTNREKFNTKTDFHESKYTNVPVPQMTAEELAEVEKKVLEIEKGNRFEDVDEDDAGVKRPSELNPTPNVDDGNSNTKTSQSSRPHPPDRRANFSYDTEHNPSKRGGWREQRGGAGINRRGQNNYPMNSQKQNQRSEQTQYTSSRSSEQSTNNRQGPYKTRNSRFIDNRSPHEGRDSPSQITNDETARGQRMNSGSFPQGQNSGPTSPSTTVPARTIHPTNNRPPIGRNSPAPYTGSSSSRNNSTAAASSPPPASSSHQTNPSGTGNYSQQSNKINRKQTRNEQQSTNEESDQPKPQRNQQQTSSNNQSNTVPLNRPSQLPTQQTKQQQQQQQQSLSSNNNVVPPLTLPTQDDHSSSHESMNSTQTDSTIHMTNPPVYVQHTTGITTPGHAKSNISLNPEADEFVPVASRESNSRPESRGAATNAMPIGTFITNPHPQALQLLLQQQTQQTQAHQQQMIPPTHAPNPAALYQQYYSTPFPNIQQYVNATPQQMGVNMMGAQMMPPQTQQQMPGSGLTGTNTNNAGGTVMATPNGGSGPAYKQNTNPTHSGDAGNTGVNNIAPKKAVVSVRSEQSNVSQQQQVPGAPQMLYPAPPIRYFHPDFMSQQAAQTSMQFQTLPFYYPVSTQGIIQATQAAAAAGVVPSQNIMISSTNSSAGPSTPAPSSIYYQDPRLYGAYPSAVSVNPNSVNPNWQLTRSPPHQQQQQQQTAEQQRGYGVGQNILSQVPQQTGGPNAGGGRSASTSGPTGQTTGGGPPMTPQYALNGTLPAAYAYASATGWYPSQQQVSSPQTNMPPQVSTYGMMFDPSQQAPPQQATYVHQNPYETTYFQQAQQQPQQQGLESVPPGNYNR